MGWSALTAQHTGMATPGRARHAAALPDSAFPQLLSGAPMQLSGASKPGDGWRRMASGFTPPAQTHARAYAEAASHPEGLVKRLSAVHPWADEALLTVSSQVCTLLTWDSQGGLFLFVSGD